MDAPRLKFTAADLVSLVVGMSLASIGVAAVYGFGELLWWLIGGAA